MTLSEDDRLWRDQNIPDVSDEQLDKIVQTYGDNTGQRTKEKKSPPKYYYKNIQMTMIRYLQKRYQLRTNLSF